MFVRGRYFALFHVVRIARFGPRLIECPGLPDSFPDSGFGRRVVWKAIERFQNVFTKCYHFHLLGRPLPLDSFSWVLENGIKDLVDSHYLDQCPGTDPHAVDVHFLIVSLSHYLYRMIVRDLAPA